MRVFGALQRYSACQDASLRVLREGVVAESFFKQTKQLLLLATDLGLLGFGKAPRCFLTVFPSHAEGSCVYRCMEDGGVSGLGLSWPGR